MEKHLHLLTVDIPTLKTCAIDLATLMAVNQYTAPYGSAGCIFSNNQRGLIYRREELVPIPSGAAL